MADPSREQRLEAQLRALPARPGVYLFRDTADDVLYVGKAKSLRPRVRSSIRGLAGRVERIEVVVTQSEAEAFHLEQSLIRRHRPPFNVRLRDDKSYPYIAVTVEDDYPRVMFTRERHRRGVVYFGPYSSAKKVRETLDVLNRAFQFRPCEGPRPGRRSGTPCLDYHIDRCLAPCVGEVSREEYRLLIDGVVEFLAGETRPIQRKLEQRMQHAAARHEFEEAARYRNRLSAVRHLAERQVTDRRAIGTVDVIGIAMGEGVAAVQLFPLREGRLVDRRSFFLENVAGQDAAEALEAFCVEHYSTVPSVPPLVVVPAHARPSFGLAAYLGELRGARVELRVALRGEKRRLAELADQNAQLALADELRSTHGRRQRRAEALEELRETLNLEALPLRIECFDVSTIQGRAPVGSMVVFEDGAPKRAHYRKFGIRREGGQDDFAMMAELVSRRFSWLGRPLGSQDGDESFATTPNLVVIDGGKGQLSAALTAMRQLDLPRVAVIALAKQLEQIFLPGESAPILLDSRSPGLQLLQRVRDEAHRFALDFHRQRRSSLAHESILDALPGIGRARKRALLRHFGSPQRLLAATPEQLEGVPGLPAKVGRRVYETLHRTGGATSVDRPSP